MKATTKKTIKKIFKIIGIVLGVVLMTLLIAVATIWFFPGTVLHDSSFGRYAVPELKKSGIDITFKDLYLRANSVTFWEKDLHLKASDFCFQLDPEEPRSCFSHLVIDLRVNLTMFKLKSLFIDRLEARSPDFKYQHTPEPDQPGSAFNPWPLMRKTAMGPVDIQIDKFEIFLPEDTLTGNLMVTNQEGEGFAAKAAAFSESKKSFISAKAEFSRERLRNLAQVFRLSKAHASVIIAPNENAEVDLQRTRVGRGEFNYRVTGAYRSPAVRVQLKSTVEQKQKRNLEGGLTGQVFLPRQLSGPLVIRQCRFTALLPEEEPEPDAESGAPASTARDDDSVAPLDRANFNCGIELATRHLVKETTYLSSLPRKIDMKLSGEATKKEAPSGNQELVGSLRLEVGPIASRMIEGKLSASYDLNFTREDEESRIDFDPILIESDLKVTRFRTLAKVLNSSRLMVPAPFNVLDGIIHIEGKGELHPSPFSGNMEVRVETNLKSPVQALDMLANGKLRFEACEPPAKNTFLEIELEATNMRLKLPNLDYKDPPAFTPDSRFVLEKRDPKRKFKCGMDYVFSFRNKDRPIFLLSDLLKKDLPVAVSLNARSDKKPEGYVRVNNYSTTLFRRRATVENFNLDFKSRALDSRIRVDYADYKIFILLSGHTQSVRMTLQSDPPLPREQVISILLFGKTLDGLEPDESGSVKDVSAAAKDGALTLASLYIFASTPIESVGYNPHTNGLVAKVKLADGTTLNVGANSQGLRDVGFTQRLSKHWRIQTTLKDPSEETQRSASTLLEWFHRF